MEEKKPEGEGEVLDFEEKTPIPRRNATKIEEKHAAMQILAAAGMGNNAIARVVEYHPASTARALTEMKKKSLQSPGMVKLAEKTVKSVMEGYAGKKEVQPDGTKKVVQDQRVKASDALRAAEMVYDRYEPKQQDQQSAPQQTFIQVNQQFLLPTD